MSNLLFPLDAIGAYIKQRQPFTSTSRKPVLSGKELRETWQVSPRVKYQIAFDSVRSDTRLDYQLLANFHARHLGAYDSFLLIDPEDQSVTSHCFGIGDGSNKTFQLQRREISPVKDYLGGPWWETAAGPRTNVMMWSQDWTQAPWTAETGVTRTANAALAPDGTMTATKHVYNGSGSSGGVRAYQASGFTVDPNIALWITSVWLRADAPCTLTLSCPHGVADAPLTVSVGTTWGNYLLPGTLAGGEDVDFQINQVGNSAITFYGWQAQSEIRDSLSQTMPTRAIKTTSSFATVNPQFWPAYSDGFRPVTDINGGISIAAGGSARTLGTDYTLPGSGVVTFGSAPAAGAVLTWTGSYFIRCTFDDDALPFDRIVKSMWSSATVNLVSQL